MLFIALSITLALVVVLVPLLLFWPSSEKIVIDEASWTMPGGGPAHLSYLPFAPKTSLHERWSTRLEGELAGPPAVAGQRVYASCSNGFLYSLDLENGRPIWRFDAASGIASMPAVSENGIFIGTLDGRVHCVDPGGESNWEVEVGGAVASTPIPDGDRVFFGSTDGSVYCVDAGDGSMVWTFEAEGPVEISPCIYEGQVFCASYEGDLFALNEKDGTLIWTYRSQGIPAVYPTADDGRVFLATEYELHCADAQSGKSLWSYSVGPSVISNLAVRGPQLIVVRGSRDTIPETVSLDVRTGDLLWDAVYGDTTEKTTLYATNEDVYMCGIDYLRVLSIESGAPSLESEIQGILPGTMTVTESCVLAGTDNRKVYCLEE
ncbi:MAG: PQQ-like beta-propeller repeat protein [Actinobacteria bacterium]|nr:PQQ-like beta-propeller repeat protein [Actinomycetota bacterium]